MPGCHDSTVEHEEKGGATLHKAVDPKQRAALNLSNIDPARRLHVKLDYNLHVQLRLPSSV
jgi:hypothetical protein